ncbi:hypothetical protein [Campylobacter sp. JMF_08 NE1]|uniref:hypothetical protein n=1 Tax=Campylobacter sp. JMF_08 NE1 TaxID=2983821 RepID=UPI0022E9F762|nr:hypothetical protein [Campylobacter sp. JMF_08 NE1]MDA3047985.1 hypothetical protein [Campylobacter sp. JMF_08 NE1]
MFRVINLIFFAFLNFAFAQNLSCENCHSVEKFDAQNHNFSCESCHKSKISPSDFPQNLAKFGGFSHENIIAHPASPAHYGEFCGSCHAKQISEFEKSNHFTHKNEIKTIFSAFNMDLNLSLQDFLSQNLPNLSEKERVVADFVERKCLKCHAFDNGENSLFSAHGKGCMACHASYAPSAHYGGSDANTSARPHSRTHTLSRADNEVCASCHNKYFIGTDFMGLFPQNTHKDYRTPLQKNGNFPGLRHGVTYANLRPDAHFSAGLVCADCHKMSETKSCEACHETATQNNTSHKFHQNLECATCHSAWGGSFYELNAMLDFSKDYENWQNLIEFDASAKRFNARALRQNTRPAPFSRTLGGERKPGIWHSAFSLERFENVLLVRKNNGKIALARPVFGYNLSIKDENASVAKFGESGERFEVWKPFSPHSVQKIGKSCEACHENPLQSRETHGGISELFAPKFCENPRQKNCAKLLDASPLNEREMQNLKSILYKKTRAKEILNLN